MRCKKEEKRKSTGNLNFVYKADNLGTGKRLSWLKRFKSLIWNNTQEKIPEAAEPSLSGTQRLLTTEKGQKESQRSSTKKLLEDSIQIPKYPALLKMNIEAPHNAQVLVNKFCDSGIKCERYD